MEDLTKSTLKRELDKLGVDPLYYSLDGDLRNDAIILYESYDTWIVFYYERGNRDSEKTFNSESDACQHILNLFRSSIKYDPSMSSN